MVGTKLGHAALLVVASSGIVYFEIERVAADDGKEYAVAVQADGTEHSAGGYFSGAGKLIQHPLQIMILYGHDSICVSAVTDPSKIMHRKFALPELFLAISLRMIAIEAAPRDRELHAR
jgi:hypothetical protein